MLKQSKQFNFYYSLFWNKNRFYQRICFTCWYTINFAKFLFATLAVAHLCLRFFSFTLYNVGTSNKHKMRRRFVVLLFRINSPAAFSSFPPLLLLYCPWLNVMVERGIKKRKHKTILWFVVDNTIVPILLQYSTR